MKYRVSIPITVCVSVEINSVNEHIAEEEAKDRFLAGEFDLKPVNLPEGFTFVSGPADLDDTSSEICK